MAEPVRVFVSHSHQDNAYCRQYVSGLRDRGCVVWYDEHNLGWGELRDAIETELERSQHFVAILSPASVTSPWVKREIDAAIHLSDSGQLDSVIFIVAERCKVPLLLSSWKRIEGPGGAPVSVSEAVAKTVQMIGAPVLPQQSKQPTPPVVAPVVTPQPQPTPPVVKSQPTPPVSPVSPVSRRTLLLGAGALAVTAASIVTVVKLVGSSSSPRTSGTHNSPTKRWSFKTGGPVASSPAVANGLVYIGSRGNYVYALDAGTGAQRWRFQTGGPVGTSSPAVGYGMVYIGSEDHYVYALDASTGAQRWRFQTGNFVESSPAVGYGLVYIGSDDSSVYALDAGTGAQRWVFQTGNHVGTSSPAAANGLVYIGSEDHYVYALDA